jgi:hypothetical protein
MSPGIHEVRPVAENVLKTLDTKLKEASAVVENNLPEGVTAYFDRNSLTQVLTNLFANAVNHNEPGIHVSVSPVSQADGFLTVSVADNGSGIAEADRGRVFERFYQAGRTYGEGSKGTGLGLTISKGLIEAMGGTIRIEGEEGKGADFRFTLPLTRQERAVPDVEKPEESEPDIKSALLFGRIAVLMRFVTPEQVNECAREQGGDSSAEKLGQILVEKEYMSSQERDLVLSVQETNLASSSPYDPEKTLADTILGRLAVSSGVLKEKHLNECLREQALLQSNGEQVLLGQLLVRKGYLTITQILELLELQRSGKGSEETKAESAVED